MLRPRYFFVASLNGVVTLCPPAIFSPGEPLMYYLDETLDIEQLSQLALADNQLERYRPVLNIVAAEHTDSRAICFTSGYFKCRKASGSLLATASGARFFAPREILNLLGFSADYKLPVDLPLSTKFRLVGNSVDVRSISYLLGQIGPLLRSHCDA